MNFFIKNNYVLSIPSYYNLDLVIQYKCCLIRVIIYVSINPVRASCRTLKKLWQEFYQKASPFKKKTSLIIDRFSGKKIDFNKMKLNTIFKNLIKIKSKNSENVFFLFFCYRYLMSVSKNTSFKTKKVYSYLTTILYLQKTCKLKSESTLYIRSDVSSQQVQE